MFRRLSPLVSLCFLFLGFVRCVAAADESYTDKFVASPLLILAVIVAIDLIVYVFHKIRK